MKVFISWSGPTSHKVAVIIRDWLPSVIQSIEPYVSSEDIDKGARWSTDIAAELHESSYGIICLSKDNILAPWINFEAGALGKSIDKSRVSPFLFRIKRSEVEGPILQFQSTIFDKDDVFKLLRSINDACTSDRLDLPRLERAFSVWWPQLEKLLNEIPEGDQQNQESGETGLAQAGSEISNVLEEILDLTRNNHRLLRDPTSLFPADYLDHILRRSSRHGMAGVVGYEGEVAPEAIRDTIEAYREVLKHLSFGRSETEKNQFYLTLIKLLREMDGPLRYMARQLNLKLPREILIESEE